MKMYTNNNNVSFEIAAQKWLIFEEERKHLVLKENYNI